MLAAVIIVTLAVACSCKRVVSYGNIETNKAVVRNASALIWVLVLIGFMPFAWYFLTANHSYIHPRLVYRSMGVTVFAWLTAWSVLIETRLAWRRSK